jgi:hypothetical protein
MRFEDRLGLHQHDGASPRRQQRRGEQEPKSVSNTQPWPARTTPKHVDLVAKGGVSHDEFAARAEAQVGRDLEWFNAARQGSETRPHPADDLEDAGDDAGDFHRQIRPEAR